MEFEEVLDRRFSCRSYTEEQVDPSVLQRILDAGRTCPTARNCQPQRVYVVQSPSALEKLATVTPCTFGAPTILMVCSNTQEACPPRGDWKDYNQIDPTIATSFMMLAAQNEGLGSCMVCMFDADEMAEAFNLPDYIKPLCLLLLGHPAADAEPSQMHGKRNDIDEFVVERL